MKKNIVWFNEVDHDDLNLVGGKGANLGELTKAGLPVPTGFIITSTAYYDFIKTSGVNKLIAKTLRGLNPEATKELNNASKIIKDKILKSAFSSVLEKQIEQYYKKMCSVENDGKDLLVAVRSSATAEDLPDASFAGQQSTFLNVSGTKQVVRSVKECFASLFEPRAIYYRTVNKFDHEKVGIAVPVQQMVQSRVSGIMFTVDPVTGNRNQIVIEAGFGLGEAIVLGAVTPDRYLVDKQKLEILDKEINRQQWCIVRDEERNKDIHKALKPEFAKSQKLSDEKILELAKLGLAIEKHYGAPQDTEWAMSHDELYMVQSRPITTLKKTAEIAGENPTDTASAVPSGEVIIKGAAASVGTASGIVKIIHSPKEIDKIEKGDVLVTEMTNPEYVPAMRRATAIVTDAGGRTSHAAIVSRELGIPCVVGTGQATAKLKTGSVVTVDGATGVVYKGNVTVPASQSAPAINSRPMSGSLNETVPITGTKVYVNLAEPEKAQEVASLPVDGVGLMRAEFIIAGMGEHPRAMVEAGRSDEYVEGLAQGMKTIAQAFDPRPVIYRATDFKTNEYRDLKGGDKFEPQESNPMIGYRGAFRYIKEPDLFKLELEAIKQVREGEGLKNLWMMIPFVRTVNEWIIVRDMVHNAGLKQISDFKLLMMCEVPSNVILLEDFIDEGIDGVSIGSNDLTQLTIGVDRDSSGELASVFDERDEAVIKSLEYIVRTCRRHGKTVSICGQAPSVYPEITEVLVKAGATSVSVSQDVAISTRKLIASVERRMILNQVVDKFETEQNS